MYQEIVSMPLVLEGIIMPTNKENTTGRNFARNSNPDYKKIRRDVFTLVEQLTESNWILTQSLQHNEQLHRKSLARIKDMKAKIEELKFDYIEYEKTKYNLGLLEERMMSITSCEERLEFLRAEKLDEAIGDAKCRKQGN